MAIAQYQITQRQTESGLPLSVMTIRLEYEVLIGPQRLLELREEVRKYANRDGEVEARLDDESYQQWLRELDRVRLLQNSMDGVKPYVLFNLVTPWSSIPKAGLETILTNFSISTESKLNVYIGGDVPNCEVVINWGAFSAKIPVSRSELQSASTQLHDLETKMKAYASSGPKTVKEVVEAIKSSAEISAGLGKCAHEIVAAAEVGIATDGVGLALFAVEIASTCGAAVAGIVDLYKAADERDAQAREAAVEKAMRAREPKEIQDGIKLGEALDRGERAGRTA
ncbi:hypothetical protein [Cupriavidus sp. BIC8F]|uniref:hypothetical protein n=1 Tax=Cupriavidus sp. BIC8F TaxID=3079014 RepID=UPI002916A1EF|nr:hypothetical protein [Cupriavidus sp. BIC8F]